MATQVTCDGCGKPAGEGAQAFGMIAPVDYCPGCTAVWINYTNLETAYRTKMVADFEAWRAARKRDLVLAQLPDA